MTFKELPISTADALKAQRDRAEQEFISARGHEGASAFYAQCSKCDEVVRLALAITQDLRALSGDTLLSNPTLWQSLRYFCAPPVSEEDLWTLVGKKFKTVPPSHADATALAFRSLLDSHRFPWLSTNRIPTAREREVAVRATALLLAHESLKTSLRGVASKRQEGQVVQALVSAGFTVDESRVPIAVLDTLARGTLSRERKVDGAKCDVPVRLHDGRLLALECKVSNGPKNSWKRLHREVGGKSERWRKEFGSQVVTGAVLAGVFDLSCLVSVQRDQSVLIFWQHDLSPLLAFASAR